jgi:tRNA(Ile)-lysidine synthase
VLTAHHADDQAETVLFRAVRGTGSSGLSGMAVLRDAVFRPLLSIWREEIEAYAGEHRLQWREDATNASPRFARNALRLRVLPEIERLVAPGARRALVRLGELAREDEAGWASVLPELLAPLSVARRAGSVSIDRAGLGALHPAVRARVIRALAASLGGTLDEAATRRAVDFVEAGASGRSVELLGGLRLRRDLDRLSIEGAAERPVDERLAIRDPGPGAGSALLAGRLVAVAWGAFSAPGRERAEFDPDRLRFPLWVRAREPGDAIRLRLGGREMTKKVKSLLLERRIPAPDRDRVPLVVDAAGDVLWIPGVARAAHPAAGGGLSIGVG